MKRIRLIIWYLTVSGLLPSLVSGLLPSETPCSFFFSDLGSPCGTVGGWPVAWVELGVPPAFYFWPHFVLNSLVWMFAILIPYGIWELSRRIPAQTKSSSASGSYRRVILKQ